MKKLSILFMLCGMVSSAVAGFKLPTSVYKSDQIAEASKVAGDESKPLVFLIAGENSN